MTKGSVTWGSHLVGFKCPVCDANMLTQRDYDDSERVFAWIARINKWFGWMGTERPEDLPGKDMSFRNHNGQLIIKDETPE